MRINKHIFMMTMCFLISASNSMMSQSNTPNIKLGSMGGHFTLQEMISAVDSLHSIYPNLISIKQSIGKTVENRDIWMIKLSDHPDINEQEPKILITAVHHANEPMGLTSVISFIHYLLENYSLNPEIKFLIDSREIYFIPIINPDGYEYNRIHWPQGCGSWRKNRAPQTVIIDNPTRTSLADTLFITGVDLYHNYNYKFVNINGFGNYPYFTGNKPFDQNETQAIKNICGEIQFNMCLNYHSTSYWLSDGYIVYPWNWTNDSVTIDEEIFRSVAGQLIPNKYYRTDNTIDRQFDFPTYYLYPSGTTEDWMYGEQIVKNKIYAFVVATRLGNWPDTNKIPFILSETNSINLEAVRLTGPNFEIDSVILVNYQNNPYIEPGQSGTIALKIVNNSVSSTFYPFTIHLSSLDSTIFFEQSTIEFSPMDAFESIINIDNPFPVQLNEYSYQGQVIMITAVICINEATIRKNLRIVVGKPSVIYQDSSENFDGWVRNNGWGLSTDRFQGLYSFTDSPSQLYHNNTVYVLQTNKYFDFSNIVQPYLSYATKWNIEPYFDYATINVSTDQGKTWNNIRGKSSHIISYNNPNQIHPPKYGYDGSQNEWMIERADLIDVEKTDSLLFQFRLDTDGWIVSDGWYIDDISIVGYPVIQPLIEKRKSIELISNSPNPFNPSTTIRFSILKPAEVSITIYNVLGQEVRRLVSKKHYEPGNHSIDWNGRNKHSQAVASGVYFYRLEAGGFSHTKKMLMIR